MMRLALVILIGNKDIECVLSIYISNVTIWLDVLDLWKSFSRRVATIYLPDRKETNVTNYII